jgi:hypothetical protein
VYKNRLLREPKPLVVGIAWVVECVEQRRRVDEAKFIVNLDGVNVAGTNKVDGSSHKLLCLIDEPSLLATTVYVAEANKTGVRRNEFFGCQSGLAGYPRSIYGRVFFV